MPRKHLSRAMVSAQGEVSAIFGQGPLQLLSPGDQDVVGMHGVFEDRL